MRIITSLVTGALVLAVWPATAAHGQTTRPAPTAGASEGPSGRIFLWNDAEKARQLARRECTPLVLHFVPDTKVGAQQLDTFYARPGGVSRELLDKVVIVVVPTERFQGFARQLGITGPGGYRTISAYDLNALDQQSQPTCRSGFV